MKHLSKVLVFLFLIPLTLPSIAQTDPATPNILLIIADDVGLDPIPNYPPFAEKANMPHLQDWIQSGITFDNVWSAPVCSPTRATILTGKYGRETGVLDVTLTGRIRETETSLHSYIDQTSGGVYNSSIIGKWHLGAGGATQDYPARLGIPYYAGMLAGATDDYFDWPLNSDGYTRDTTSYITSTFTDLAIDWINQQNQPWFCWLAYTVPHTPIHLPPLHMHDRDTLPNDSASIDNDPLPYYLAMIESLDYEMGRLLDSMPPAVVDNTIFIFIGDNGTLRRGIQQPYRPPTSKGSLYQGGINVPMIISGPGVTRVNEREDALINTSDLFSTIVELTGTNLAYIHDSYSFANLLSDQSNGTRCERSCVYSEVLSDSGYHRWTARNYQYKIVTNDTLVYEFYDLVDDPYENNDLMLDTATVPLSVEQQTAFNTLLTGCQSEMVGRDIFEPNNERSEAAPFPPSGIHRNAAVCNSFDFDWYWYIPQHSNVQVSLSNLDFNCALMLIQGNDTVFSDRPGPEDEVVNSSSITPGDTAFIYVYGKEGGGSRDGYSLRVLDRPTSIDVEKDTEQSLDALPEPISLYPNPAQNQLHIRTHHSNLGKLAFTLYDAQSRIVLQHTWQSDAPSTQTLDLSSLPVGMYHYRIHTPTHTMIGNVIKEQ